MSIIIGITAFIASNGFASWQGPIEVISSTWGSNAGQIGIAYGDIEDDFARSFGVSQSGNIVIADSINEVLHIFNSNGDFQRDIKNTFAWRGWPGDVLVKSECAVVNYVQFTQTFNVLTGTLIGKADNMGGADYVSDDCLNIYLGGSSGWKIYSPTGQIIKTLVTKPLELGVVRSSSKQADGSRQTVISYNDATYSINSPKMLEYFTRNTSGYIYGVIITGPGVNQYYRVYKYNKCGKALGYVDLPANNIVVAPNTTMPPKPTPDVNVIAEYGKPVIAPNGDVYCWERTDEQYKILKWIWQDNPNVQTGPDAPTGLTLMPSTSGLYLTWTASVQDPGCVSGYEISRVTTSGGVGSTVATLNAGVVKYNDTTVTVGTTYFYKIRAVAGGEYSPYTAEVSEKK